MQPQLTLHSFSKQIKQESDEKTNSQRPKKKISTYILWFDPQLWPLIQIVVGKHKNLTNVLHYLWTFHKKPRHHNLTSFDELAKSEIEWFTPHGRFKLASQNSTDKDIAFIRSQQVTILEHMPKFLKRTSIFITKHQSIWTSLLRPIDQPIIHGFFNTKLLNC